MPRVSVIIPCYNQGRFLEEAVDSVLCQTFTDLEIIIVNDGSDDPETVSMCNSYDDPRISVLNTANQGLAAARNNGIRAARGEYILPLDADDRIGPDYLEEAVAVLDGNPDVGIVYSEAKLFGAVETKWPLPQYSLKEMLKNNIIFCSALYRKSDWELVGGYDKGMIYGWEDYDFWLSLLERGKKVLQLPAPHFFYRVDPNSMVRSKQRWQKIEMFKRIYQRHISFFSDNIEIWLEAILAYNEPIFTSRLYVNEGEGISDKISVSQEVTSETKLLRFPLSQFVNRKEVRFDPIDCPACIEILWIRLFTGTKEEHVDLDTITSNALFKDRNIYMFKTDDPQMFFNLSHTKLQETSEIKVALNIRSTKEKALIEIIEFVTNISNSSRKPSLLTSLFMSTRKL